MTKCRDVFSAPAPDDPAARLAQAVVGHAARCVQHGDPEPVAWLLDEETENTWLFMANVSRRDILSWVQSGCRRERKKLRRRRLGKLPAW